ncbi:MAG: NADPH-dependent 7-cyano-7-deazaguanine reductase QueF [Candidatus Omnitrophica bacterium]|nr:NADPH-dependent 7-cyano-7-deazaguanine reductase QueF [Candidatus Omnitrophota bacterium]
MIHDDRTTSRIEKKAKKTQGKTFFPADIDASILETFNYEYPKQPINIEHKTSEFTCVCPYSGLPDFAVLTITYTPDKKCIELKSLKYYLYAFRQVKIFNEHAVNKILKDLTKALNPRRMEIIGEFSLRGGISNKVTASYKKPKR